MPDQVQELIRELQSIAPNLRELLGILRWLFDPGPVVWRALRTLVQPLQAFLDSYLLSTTDVIGGGQFTHAVEITRIEPYLAGVADAGLAAAFIWGCYQMMWSHSARSLYTVRHLLPRVLLAVLLINFALPLFQAAVDFENAVTEGIRAIPLGFSWTGNLWALADSNDPGGVPVLTLLTLAALYAGYAVLACAYAIRYALLVVLAVTAPIAGLLFVLPDTHSYAREWGALLMSTLFMQPVQLLVLAIGFQLENDVSHATVNPVRHLFALGCLIIAFKVPGALHSTSQVGTRAMSSARHYATLALHPRHVA
jgi:hypothetical protein